MNILKVKNKILAAGLAIFLTLQFMPLTAQAQLPRIPCPQGLRCPGNTSAGYTIASINDLIFTIVNWLVGIAFALAILFLVVGGFRYILSGGNEEAADSAKRTIFNALIGIVIIVLSYTLVSVVVNTLTAPSVGP
jgi:succinate dehydrogenase/fumarate reductase cytochrome b subunit